MDKKRRQFLRNTSLTIASGIILPGSIFPSPFAAKKIRILVWDERSDAEKETYENYLGNYIAGQLKLYPEFDVRSVALDDPDQGISTASLNQTDVLFWWGHTRQGEISVAKGKDYDSRLTPYTVERKFPDGQVKLEVHLPVCCFPAYRNDGKSSTVNTLRPGHPIMKGLPKKFVIPQTEMYDEPFHVPAPDDVIFEESWATGEWFRSGMLWNIGKGKLFYFRPGHETFPVFKEKNIITILANAAKWMAP